MDETPAEFMAGFDSIAQEGWTDLFYVMKRLCPSGGSPSERLATPKLFGSESPAGSPGLGG
jgi:hypothetical protein